MLMLDTPVFTDCENVDSGGAIKDSDFYENLGRSCIIDDPQWNWSITRETTESTATAYLGYPGVLRITEETWELTNSEWWPLRNTWCREIISSASKYES